MSDGRKRCARRLTGQQKRSRDRRVRDNIYRIRYGRGAPRIAVGVGTLAEPCQVEILRGADAGSPSARSGPS